MNEKQTKGSKSQDAQQQSQAPQKLSENAGPRSLQDILASQQRETAPTAQAKIQESTHTETAKGEGADKSDALTKTEAAALVNSPTKTELPDQDVKGQSEPARIGLTERNDGNYTHSGQRIKDVNPASIVNQRLEDDFVARGGKREDFKAPYAEGTMVFSGGLEKQNTLSQAHKGEAPKENGNWYTSKSDVANFNASEVKDRYAIPGDRPTHVSDFDLGEGTNFTVGAVQGHDGWGKGGGKQYHTNESDKKDLANTRPLPSNVNEQYLSQQPSGQTPQQATPQQGAPKPEHGSPQQPEANSSQVSADFESGASYLAPAETVGKYTFDERGLSIQHSPRDGSVEFSNYNHSVPEGGKFVVPTNELNELVEKAYRNPEELANQINSNLTSQGKDPIDFQDYSPLRVMEGSLGLQQGCLGNAAVKIDIPNSVHSGLELTDGTEIGANEQHLQGEHKTPGGQSEAKLTGSYSVNQDHISLLGNGAAQNYNKDGEPSGKLQDSGDKKEAQNTEQQHQKNQSQTEPKQESEAPKKEGETPKQEGVASKQESEAPKKEGVTPKQDNEAPKQEGEAPKQEGETLKKEGEAQKQDGETPKQGSETPKKESEAPKQGSETPKKEGEAPKQDGETPKQEGEATKQEGEAPKQDGETPKKEGEPSKRDGEAPKKEGETPKREGEAPKQEGEAPKQDGEAPKQEGEAPKQEVEAPKKEGETPRQENQNATSPQKEAQNQGGSTAPRESESQGFKQFQGDTPSPEQNTGQSTSTNPNQDAGYDYYNGIG